MNPKVLVLSNECFSKSKSNGRTLGNFFHGWPKENLAQFYLSADDPDFDVCSNYFRVTDRQALSALKNGACDGSRVIDNQKAANATSGTAKRRRRNALTMLARNLVWKSGRWKTCGFEEWVKEFNPDIILLQAGDFAFMFRLAVRLAEKHDAKLVIYNSEGYYFKDFDYFKSSGIAKALYPLFRRDLKAALEKAYKHTDYIFYICDDLKRAYDEVFHNESETIYTTSEMIPKTEIVLHKEFIVSYCGNLGLNRHKGLIEIAETLQEISPELFVNVYGKIPNKRVEDDFKQCNGIHYHGLVPYDQVAEILHSSDLLLHVESFDKFYQEDLKFAFSTKIADSLSSGTCFLLFAPESLACSKYLIENEAAYVVSDKSKLKKILKMIIENADSRQRYISRALELADKNHNGEKNVQKFQKALENL